MSISPGVGFVAFLLLTVLLLAGVVVTGFAAKRRVHLTLVAATIVSLGATIFFAEALGRLYDLKAAGTIYPVHLTLAKITTLAYLLPILSGWRTILKPTFRPWHRRAAFLILALTLTTFVTGTWMLLAAERLDTVPHTTR